MKKMSVGKWDECEDIYIKSDIRKYEWGDLSSLNLNLWTLTITYDFFLYINMHKFKVYILISVDLTDANLNKY